jgi:hypothetical protein
LWVPWETWIHQDAFLSNEAIKNLVIKIINNWLPVWGAIAIEVCAGVLRLLISKEDKYQHVQLI